MTAVVYGSDWDEAIQGAYYVNQDAVESETGVKDFGEDFDVIEK